MELGDLVAVEQQQALQPFEDVAAEVQPDAVRELALRYAELDAAAVVRGAEPPAELDAVAVLERGGAGVVVVVLHLQEIAEEEVFRVDPLAGRDGGQPFGTEFDDEAGAGGEGDIAVAQRAEHAVLENDRGLDLPVALAEDVEALVRLLAPGREPAGPVRLPLAVGESGFE